VLKMSQEECLADQFCEESPKGFGDHYDGRLKAEDNPEFLNEYGKLLSENDRVIHMAAHADQAGVEFLASEAHMLAMKDAGYEYLLLEFPLELNDLILSYENGSIEQVDFEDSVYEILFHERAAHDSSLKGEIYDENYRSLMEDLSGAYVQAVVTAKDFGVKVRMFDDYNAFTGENALEDTRNAHIDFPIFRRDDEWDSYIEALTAGKKAVLYAGAGHVASSYGIDEYIEDRGYKVGTFRIKNEQNVPSPVPDEVYDAPDFLDSFLSSIQRRDEDGFDSDDFTPDLFYHEQTKRLTVVGNEAAIDIVTPVDPAVDNSVVVPDAAVKGAEF